MPSPATLPSQYQVVPRRSSYTSMVHQDKEQIKGSSCSVHKLAQCLAEWLVVLQGVAEERELDLPAVNCRCSKAVKINEELKSLSRKMNDAWQVVERVGQVQTDRLEEISEDILRIAAILRSDVSILIPSAIGRAELAVAEQARSLLADGDMKAVVTEAMDGVAKLVFALLGVENCRHCNSHGDGNQLQPMEDIDADIMSMVASMCNTAEGMPSSDTNISNKPTNKNVGKEVLERSRKRKQNRPSRILNPVPTATSMTGSPIKKMRKVGLSDNSAPATQTEILFLLEKKKKLVKKDGLYKFVLWREALKDEKTKMVT